MLKTKKAKVIISAVAVTLVAGRIALPSLVEDFINQTIADNPKISGGVDEIDLWLLSGRASAQGLELNKAGASIPVPILSSASVAFSISWKDLFRGRLFGDIEVVEPVLNIVDAKREENIQTGAEIDWRQALTDFYPFEINRIYLHGGTVHFRNFSSDPPVDLYIENVEASAKNITNELEIENSQAAQIRLSATTIGNGKLSLESDFNLLREPARASITGQLVDFKLPALNEFTKAYANLDIQEGNLAADVNFDFTENDAVADMKGEVKPTLTNVNVLRWREDAQLQQDSGLIIAWEGLVDAAKWVLEAGPRDRVTTTIPIEGSVKDPDIHITSAIISLLKNKVQSWFKINQTEDGHSQDKENEEGSETERD